MIEDDELHILLGKPYKGEVWPSVFKGHKINPAEEAKMREKMMIERFQEENPGFDFSGAKFNGNVPDPQKFMGGVQYK